LVFIDDFFLKSYFTISIYLIEARVVQLRKSLKIDFFEKIGKNIWKKMSEFSVFPQLGP